MVRRLAQDAGVDLSPAACWLLVRLGEDPHTDLAEVSQRFDVPLEVAERGLEELKTKVMVAETPNPDGGTAGYTLTPAGEQAVEKLVAARRASLARLLDGWSPEEHVDLAHLLTRLATELVGERPAEVAPSG